MDPGTSVGPSLQSECDMRLMQLSGMAVLAVVTLVAAAGAETIVRRVPLPANVASPGDVREFIEEIAALSPTVQRQLAVIAAAPARVVVRVTGAPMPAMSRALTTIRKYEAGFIDAEIVLPVNSDQVELLAHELEHVVEQIERVDLAALERAGLAWRDRLGVFETERAHAAGHAAASEVENAPRH